MTITIKTLSKTRHYIGASIAAFVIVACSPADSPTDTASKTTQSAQEETTKASTQTAGFDENKNVYFGDLHIHTKNSFDAYIFNVRSTPDDVYRFAKGESVRHPSGFDIKIGGDPLDFVAATDHGAYMGILPQLNNPCLLYTSPSPRDQRGSRMPSSA